MAANFLRVVNRERAALADLLHRGPLQEAAALVIRMETLANTADEEEVQEIRDLVSKLSGSLLAINHSLRAPDEPGRLALRLERLGEICRRHLDLNVTGPGIGMHLLPEEVEDVVVDAVEATLLVAHAQSITEISLSLHRSSAELRVFAELRPCGSDLSSLHERVRSKAFLAARGELSLEQGTSASTVLLKFPIPQTGSKGPQ